MVNNLDGQLKLAMDLYSTGSFTVTNGLSCKAGAARKIFKTDKIRKRARPHNSKRNTYVITDVGYFEQS